MTIPNPLPETALLGDIDSYIKDLAEDLDLLLDKANAPWGGPGMKYAFIPPNTEVEVPAHPSDVQISFEPKLTEIHGFVVSTPGRILGKGAITGTPGWVSVFPSLPLKIVPYTYPAVGGIYTDPIRAWVMTVGWSNLSAGPNEWIGAQTATEGTRVKITGFAWGDPW